MTTKDKNILEQTTPLCAICGQERDTADGWFLLADSQWQDKLKILKWHDLVAAQNGIRSACCAEHVQQLVVHWMTTGSLNYPFARTGRESSHLRWRRTIGVKPPEVDLRLADQIGELSVHRESIERVLQESPCSLTAILEALLGALQRKPAYPRSAQEREAASACMVAEEV